MATTPLEHKLMADDESPRRRARTASTRNRNHDDDFFVGGLVPYSDDHKAPALKVSAVKQANAWRILCGFEEVAPGKRLSMLRCCMIELLGTCLFFWCHVSMINTGIAQYGAYPAGFIAVYHAIMVPLFIYCAGPGSGGHLVTTISISTAMTGHTSWIRCGLYLISQTLGSVLGVSMAYASMGQLPSTPNATDAEQAEALYLQLGGDMLGSHTQSSRLAEEIMATIVLLFVAYGVAFDPLNSKLFGPILAPVLVGLALGSIIYWTAGLSALPSTPPGLAFHIYLAPAIVAGHYPDSLWIYFLGPVIACAIHSLFFYVAPPHHGEFGMFTPPLLFERRKKESGGDGPSIAMTDRV